MKLVVVNGSPRKGWNTDQLLNNFVNGMKSAGDLKVQKFDIYDYTFSGCRSCFLCKLKTFEEFAPQCRFKDGAIELIKEIREADVVVIGSPIYFQDITAQLKSFLERVMYPGKSRKNIPIFFVYTMNGDKKNFNKVAINVTHQYWKANFGYEPKYLCSYDTYQRDREELYKKSSHDMESKKIRREVQFPLDLKQAYDAGDKFYKEIIEARGSCDV